MDDANFHHFVQRFEQDHGKRRLSSLRSPTANSEFLTRLILGFIEANPDKKSSKRRKESALVALVGDTPFDPRAADDERLLESMAERYLADRSPTALRKPRSLRKLALDVASLSPGHSKDATADRLRKKFQARREEFLALAGDEGTDIELVMRAALYDIEIMLAKFGVRFSAES